MANSSTLTDFEQLGRRESVDFARASVGLSGFKVTEAMEAHAQRFVSGEIDLEEFVKPGLPSSSTKRSGSQDDPGA